MHISKIELDEEKGKNFIDNLHLLINCIKENVHNTYLYKVSTKYFSTSILKFNYSKKFYSTLCYLTTTYLDNLERLKWNFIKLEDRMECELYFEDTLILKYILSSNKEISNNFSSQIMLFDEEDIFCEIGIIRNLEECNDAIVMVFILMLAKKMFVNKVFQFTNKNNIYIKLCDVIKDDPENHYVSFNVNEFIIVKDIDDDFKSQLTIFNNEVSCEIKKLIAQFGIDLENISYLFNIKNYYPILLITYDGEEVLY